MEKSVVTDNGVVTFRMGAIEVPMGDWEYRVSTAFGECTLSLSEAMKPDGGKCSHCRRVFTLGQRAEHVAFLRHLAIVTIPVPRTVNQQGQVQMSQVQQVSIDRGGEVRFAGAMEMQGLPAILPGGLRMRLVLEARIPIKPLVLVDAEGE